jgi:hypothetical protein
MAGGAIETGMMAVLNTGEIVRIMALIDEQVVVEGMRGRLFLEPDQIVRTYSPREANGANFDIRHLNDDGIELLEGEA